MVYHIYKTNGEMQELHNPVDMPDGSVIDHIEEPWIKATIMVPDEYLGSVLGLCTERRGQQVDLTYVGNRAMAVYRIPLNEVVFDFYDRLKSVSRGYASFDYAMDGYAESDLVRISILVNGDLVDALSFIAHRAAAENRGRQICARLKDLIPKQLFKIAIQAAIGSRVVARETISALSKDVTAKCYGGDISRKRKLLEKQKEGKKRMRQFGKVEIPQSAFLAALKMDAVDRGLRVIRVCGGRRLVLTAAVAAGEMAERLKAHAWKACVRESVPRVRNPCSLRQFRTQPVACCSKFTANMTLVSVSAGLLKCRSSYPSGVAATGFARYPSWTSRGLAVDKLASQAWTHRKLLRLRDHHYGGWHRHSSRLRCLYSQELTLPKVCLRLDVQLYCAAGIDHVRPVGVAWAHERRICICDVRIPYLSCDADPSANTVVNSSHPLTASSTPPPSSVGCRVW